MSLSIRNVFRLALLLSFSLIFGASVSLAQEKMSMEDYNAQLAQWQGRETVAKQALDACAKASEEVKKEIEAMQGQVDETWKAIYEEIGVDADAVDAYRQSLKDLDAQVAGLLALSPEELFKKREEIKDAEAKLAALKQNPIFALTEMQNLVAGIEGKLTQIKNKMPKAIYDEYSVVVGDYLWKISGKRDIYADPMQWMRIYSYNKDQIKDPDLIYPQQILKIQREVGPDEYLVQKGDFLSKIAGNADVLGDPGSWAKIYERNKDVIGGNANMIFPYTVLVIPAN
ncbi:MAG TPA: LysM peptidoglycan-binding domain-containing protein [bacterium]|jgi:nucleoid-associated protein YgaU|nr:LysM peptidoglycan-binding domain-containing protein [bacterium]HNT64761.1 LysM peptidoglycan-binding domain-containing protein [bacterium]HOX85922.1 LysM peptidoglycan-binding domain-containing protein [bacterium]HPG45095.1 LysM peptidoglycan-binding domain-containing protein [bacterium]